MSDTKDRSKFLQVLCIMTFIGSIAYVISLFSIKGSNEMSTGFQLSILGMNLGTAAGAWMMWNLKKIGFYLYVFCELTAVIIPLVIAYSERPAIQAFFALSFISILAIVSVLMVILYWMAIKEWWAKG